MWVTQFGKHSSGASIRKADAEGKFVKSQLYFEASYYLGMAFWLLVAADRNM